MDKLVPLPSIARLSKCVVRVLGQVSRLVAFTENFERENPGKFTLQGTNTYIIGTEAPYVLLDTGEGKGEYPPFLEEALRDVLRNNEPPRRIISDVILSHRHHDHHKGLPSVLNLLHQLWRELPHSANGRYLPPLIHKYPLAEDSKDESLIATLAALEPGTYVENRNRDPPSPLHDLQDLQVIHGTGASLNVYHTPGHTGDSVCIFLPQDEAIFTADTVLGQGTAVFENLAQYIKSLQRLISGEKGIVAGKLYPGHGPVVEEGRKTIEMYIKHRLEREEQIVSLLGGSPPKGHEAWRIMDIVPALYKDYPREVWPAAAHGVRQHLEKLEGEGRVKKIMMGTEEGWQLVD